MLIFVCVILCFPCLTYIFIYTIVHTHIHTHTHTHIPHILLQNKYDASKSKKKSLMDKYEYVMHGKVFRVQPGSAKSKSWYVYVCLCVCVCSTALYVCMCISFLFNCVRACIHTSVVTSVVCVCVCVHDKSVFICHLRSIYMSSSFTDTQLTL